MSHDSISFRTISFRNRSIYVIIAFLCFLGILISGELTRIHFFAHTDPAFHSKCAINEAVDCQTVALSPYSVFAGLPISVWGMIGYLLMAVLAVLGIIGNRIHPLWPCGGLLFFSSLSLVVSVILAFVSFTRIDSICLFCMASYAINLSLLGLCIAGFYRSGMNPIAALITDARTLVTPPAGVITIIGGGVIISAVLCITPYWDIAGWSDLPRLPHGVDETGEHWIGASSPIITIIEFSDYECPHCRKAHKKMRLLAAGYPEKVRLYHRHLPLDKACHPMMKKAFHNHACNFAKAAECAGQQGKFWEMNDALFSQQDKIKASDVKVTRLAVQLGLDSSVFKQCMAGRQATAKIEEDLKTAIKMRLNGTPTFLIGGDKYVGHVPKSVLTRVLK